MEYFINAIEKPALENIERYDLHKNDYSKLHFEINDANSYLGKNWGKATKPHRHSFYQLIWFKNKGRHFVDYEVIEHPPNTLFFLNRNQIHYFCTETSNEGYLIHFDEFFLEEWHPGLMKRFAISIFNEIGRSYAFLSNSEAERMGLVISLIKDELKTQDHFYREQVFHNFIGLLFLVERYNKKQALTGLEPEKDYTLAVAFNDLVHQYVKEFIGIEEFAARLGTNSKKLSAISKKYFLTTPGNLVKQRKVLEAKRMLANNQVSVKELAYAMGFEQPTYFTKYFKKATGLTPKEFQNSIL